MKQFFFLLALLFFSRGYACDICGCSGSTNFLGILPLVQQNLAGVRFQYTKFNHPNTNDNFNGESQVFSDEYFHTEAWFRLNPAKRIQVFAFVPYKWNVRTESERTTTIQGVGDVQLMGNYNIILPEDSSTAVWKHFLRAGLSLRMPTGKYMQRDETKAMLPTWFQVGTGSWGTGVNLFYTVRYKKLGLNLNAQYMHNSTNEMQYHFGNQTAISLMGFYWLDIKRSTFLPQLGVGLDYFGEDESYGVPESSTGGSRFVATFGVDWYINRFLISGFTQMPLAQNLPDAQPTFAARFGFSTSVFFN
jgi:hypothetical protein